MKLSRIKAPLVINKRHKIIITSLILFIGLLSTQLVPFYLTVKFILGLAGLSYVLSFWALWQKDEKFSFSANKLQAVILLILPTLFTLAVASYYFLLPVRWLTRVPVALIFGLTFYALLLSQNVFNVSSVRTIPLYRVASTVILVLTLLTAFLLFNVIFSLNLNFLYNGLIVFLLSGPLILQILWTIEMENLTSVMIVYTLLLSLVLGEVGIVLSFWPISQAMASLILSTTLYITLGLSTQYLREKLSEKITWEYVIWGILILLVATITTSWVG